MNGRLTKPIQDLKWVANAVAILITFGLIIVLFKPVESRTTAILWSFATLALGMLFGFLFGIPRVLQESSQNPSTPKSIDQQNENQTNSQPLYRLQVNTNLEQISDWLTKIIVGIGLVELRRIPDLMGTFAQFISKGLGGTDDTEVFAMAFIIYFAVVGFLGGYLVTRIYLAAAFSRADQEAQQTVTFAGTDLLISKILKDLSSLIGDLREQLVNFVNRSNVVADQAKASSHITNTSRAVKSILWVTGSLENNSVLIEQLTKSNIQIVTSSSTKDALTKLNQQKFDRIVSDIGRWEEKRFNEIAGLDLVKAIRANDTTTPIVIFCSMQEATKYQSEAVTVGANAITSSPTGLLLALNMNI